MKKTFLFFFTLIGVFINAQNTTNEVFKDGYVWESTDLDYGDYFSPINDREIIYGDTIINNINYKIVYHAQFYNDSVKLFQDSTQICSKLGYVNIVDDIYYFIKDGDSSRKVLYDFTAQVGDTLTRCGFYPFDWNEENIFDFNTFFDSLICIVDSIKIININDIDRKKYFISYLNSGGFYEEWIEGIGGCAGLTFKTPDITHYTHGRTCIYEAYSSQSEGKVIDSLNSCWSSLTAPCGFTDLSKMECINLVDSSTSLFVKNNEESNIIISPNPSTDLINVRFDNYHILNDYFFFKIYNSTGQPVMRIDGNSLNFQEIDISGLNNGIYLLVIQDKYKNISSKKFNIIR